MIRLANAETKMDMGWIAVGGLTVGLIGWCIPRPAERAAIASYPKGVVGRLMLPFSDWEDHVAGSDIETVRGLRRRVAIGGLVASEVWTSRKRRGRVESKWLISAAVTLGVAFGIWNLDLNNIMCAPHSLLQGHAVWHLLCALSTYLLYRYYCSATL